MTVQIVMVFHLIAAVRIIYFARARVVTLESANLIAQVRTLKQILYYKLNQCKFCRRFQLKFPG